MNMCMCMEPDEWHYFMFDFACSLKVRKTNAKLKAIGYKLNAIFVCKYRRSRSITIGGVLIWSPKFHFHMWFYILNVQDAGKRRVPKIVFPISPEKNEIIKNFRLKCSYQSQWTIALNRAKKHAFFIIMNSVTHLMNLWN